MQYFSKIAMPTSLIKDVLKLDFMKAFVNQDTYILRNINATMLLEYHFKYENKFYEQKDGVSKSS